MDDSLAKVRELKERVKDLEKRHGEDHDRIKKLERELDKMKALKAQVREYLDR